MVTRTASSKRPSARRAAPRAAAATAAPTPIRPGSALAAEFWETGRSATCPVYDMHGHMGTWKAIHFPCATPDAMVHHMDRAGVKVLCFAHHAALFLPELANAPAIAAARRFPGRLCVYVGINPHYPEQIRQDLASFDGLRPYCVGLKFLADYHATPITAEAFHPALEFAQERGLPILLHTWGGSGCNGPAQVREVAKRYPRVRFLLGHSFNNDWAAAVAVAKAFPNTYLELTSLCGLRGVIEFLVRGAGSERLLYGTDLPWFEEHQGIGSLLAADISDDDIHNILHRNAEKLLAGNG